MHFFKNLGKIPTSLGIYRQRGAARRDHEQVRHTQAAEVARHVVLSSEITPRGGSWKHQNALVEPLVVDLRQVGNRRFWKWQ